MARKTEEPTQCVEMAKEIASIKADLKENNSKTIKVYEAIYGNGKDGLITEFKLLRQSVENHHQSVEKLQNKTTDKWQWAITTAVAVVAIIVSFAR